MVGADAAKTLQPCQRERRIMEDVIERPAAKRVVGVEGAEHAASATRIEHAADTLEKPRRVRPGHIIEIAGDDCWPATFLYLVADD